MIFHGVYTTPQIIDSTLSTSSNNAVNGQAVAEYVSHKIANVEDQIANAGGGCSMCREGFITDSSQYKINKSQALIIGQSVKMYIEFETLWDNDGNVLIGTLNEDIPQPDSEITTTATANGQSPVSIKLIGNQITMLSSNHTIARGDTFHATIEYGGESGGGGDEPQYVHNCITCNSSWETSTALAMILGKFVFIQLDLVCKSFIGTNSDSLFPLGQINDSIPKPIVISESQGLIRIKDFASFNIDTTGNIKYSTAAPFYIENGHHFRGYITYICE
jgi:hypothetical protein